MDVEFTVGLVELKRAFRRLSVRLSDESEAGGKNSLLFDAQVEHSEGRRTRDRRRLIGLRRSVGKSQCSVSCFLWHRRNLAVLSRKSRLVLLLGY